MWPLSKRFFLSFLVLFHTVLFISKTNAEPKADPPAPSVKVDFRFPKNAGTPNLAAVVLKPEPYLVFTTEVPKSELPAAHCKSDRIKFYRYSGDVARDPEIKELKGNFDCIVNVESDGERIFVATYKKKLGDQVFQLKDIDGNAPKLEEAFKDKWDGSGGDWWADLMYQIDKSETFDRADYVSGNIQMVGETVWLAVTFETKEVRRVYFGEVRAKGELVWVSYEIPKYRGKLLKQVMVGGPRGNTFYALYEGDEDSLGALIDLSSGEKPKNVLGNDEVLDEGDWNTVARGKLAFRNPAFFSVLKKSIVGIELTRGASFDRPFLFETPTEENVGAKATKIRPLHSMSDTTRFFRASAHGYVIVNNRLVKSEVDTKVLWFGSEKLVDKRKDR